MRAFLVIVGTLVVLVSFLVAAVSVMSGSSEFAAIALSFTLFGIVLFVVGLSTRPNRRSDG